MSYLLSQLEGAERRAECDRQDALLRTDLHRVMPPEPDPMWSNEGRNSEASRKVTELVVRNVCAVLAGAILGLWLAKAAGWLS